MATDASRILAYSCLHLPYEHKKAFTFLSSLKREYKPTAVVCLGDVCDLHQLSKWPKHPECLSAADEIKQAKEKVKLLIDSMSYQYLIGAEIDYVENSQGAQFVIKNPSAASTCGCGSSFSV